jgi:ribose transport system ATP-binding protein
MERAATTVDELIALILGHQVTSTPPADHPIHEGQPLLEVLHLTTDVFTDISLNVNHGEIVGVYGAIGAGHFDLARAIFGMYRYEHGAIRVGGHLFPNGFSAAYAIAHGLAYATESRRKSLFMDEPIYRNVVMPHLNRVGALFPMASQELAAAQPALKQVGVRPADPLNPVGKLSGGNQQKVVIARWLAFPPRVFIMSEPTRGMDVGAKSEVLNLLRDFRDQGFGVLVVSSEPETILAVCDRVIVMSRGHIVTQMVNKNLNKDVLMRLL